jgi:hypothetical protein
MHLDSDTICGLHIVYPTCDVENAATPYSSPKDFIDEDWNIVNWESRQFSDTTHCCALPGARDRKKEPTGTPSDRDESCYAAARASGHRAVDRSTEPAPARAGASITKQAKVRRPFNQLDRWDLGPRMGAPSHTFVGGSVTPKSLIVFSII